MVVDIIYPHVECLHGKCMDYPQDMYIGSNGFTMLPEKRNKALSQHFS